MCIETDRWFKLRADKWIATLDNQARGFRSGRIPSISNPTRWYHLDVMWEQVAVSIAEGSKYSEEEVIEYLRARVAAAKLEELLDDIN